jgi:septum formation protein
MTSIKAVENSPNCYTFTMHKKIILASQSPRRRDLLAKMGVPFTAITSDFEEHLDDTRSPAEVAQELGLGKALAVARKHPDALVIASDSIISIDGKQLDKPVDRQHARDMIQLLSGRTCLVTVSIVVVCLADDLEIVEVEEAGLHLWPFDAQQVEAYLDRGAYHDKTAGLGIQSGAHKIIEYIEGDVDAIIGLPTRRLARILQELAIEAQPATIDSPWPQKSVAK